LVKGREGAYIFFVKYGHSELELAPGLKGVSISSLSEIPAIVEKVIEVVNSGYFDEQMKTISEKLSSKIQKGKVEKAANSSAPVQAN
jgi:hypothetical protein